MHTNAATGMSVCFSWQYNIDVAWWIMHVPTHRCLAVISHEYCIMCMLTDVQWCQRTHMHTHTHRAREVLSFWPAVSKNAVLLSAEQPHHLARQHYCKAPFDHVCLTMRVCLRVSLCVYIACACVQVGQVCRCWWVCSWRDFVKLHVVFLCGQNFVQVSI